MKKWGIGIFVLIILIFSAGIYLLIKDSGPSFDEEWELYNRFFSGIDNKNVTLMDSISYEAGYTNWLNINPQNFWDSINNSRNSGRLYSREEVVEFWKDTNQTILLSGVEEVTRDWGTEKITKRVSFIRNPKGTLLLFELGPGMVIGETDEDFLDSDKDGRLNKDELCLGIFYESFPETCRLTDVNVRDSDGDGWWDGIEYCSGAQPCANTDPNDPNDYPFRYFNESED